MHILLDRKGSDGEYRKIVATLVVVQLSRGIAVSNTTVNSTVVVSLKWYRDAAAVYCGTAQH